MDIIFIESLEFDCIIGILEHERTTAQPLSIDLKMHHDIRPAARSGQLDQSLDYAAISKWIIEFCIAQQAELIETLAQNLADALFNEFQISKIDLTIRKPNAVPEARAVGVHITRELPLS